MNDTQTKTAEYEFQKWWLGLTKGQIESEATLAIRDAMKIGFLAGYSAHLEVSRVAGTDQSSPPS